VSTHDPACQALVAHFSAYLDGETSPELSTTIEAQCAACADCRALLATLDATRRLTVALPTPALPTATAARLHAALGLPPG
jgi:anti-sigma factor RsiW